MAIRSTLVVLLAVVLLSPGVLAQDQWPTKKWPTAPPKEVGLDPAVLAAFEVEIAKGTYTYVDTVTVIRHDKIAFDKTYPRDYEKIYGEQAKKSSPIIVHDQTGPFNPFNSWWHPYYRRGDLHTLQSVTKAIVSVIIGVAIARNEFPSLDTRVMKYFDEKKVGNVDDRKRNMTIRHLLTMTSGVEWTYTATPISDGGNDTDTDFEKSYDWVKFAIDRPMAAEPGKAFNYASGNVQLLVQIFNTAVGMDIEEYAARHLFAPLGIENFYWKRTPAGVVDASGGLYLRPHDLAKIGYLYLHKGMWDGKQIVTADWVKASVTGHVDTPDIFKGSKWGYLWGTMPYGAKGQHTVFGAGGYGGQGLMVYPDCDAVIVYTGWNIVEQPKLSPPAITEHFHLAVTDGKGDGKKPEDEPDPPPAFGGSKAGDERVVNNVKLCWCPPGKFTMGSPATEPERRPGEDQVEVTLSKGFWVGKYEVTQGDWKRVVGKLPGELTAELPEGDDYPVGNVNFAEAEAFCAKLTERGRRSGELPKDWEFRLPTEAQWEYACRAGTKTATSFGDKLSSKQANFKGKPYNGAEEGPSLGKAAKVGSYPANPWGIHDMHGNTFEWCRDWYHAKLPGGTDPDLYAAKDTAQKNRTGDYSRARRGGAWTDDGWPCRSAFRVRFEPERRYDHIGFRVVAVRP